jgi:hypothetical protein
MAGHGKPPDESDLVREAIAYLAQTDLVLKWGFSEADPPPPEVAKRVASYFSDGEIEVTTSSLVCDYLISRLREDCPLTEDAGSRPAVCRIVRGDDGDDFT